MKKKDDKDRPSSSTAKEAVDATSILKKLTPKLKKSFTHHQSNEDKAGISQGNSRQVSTSSLEKTASRKSVGDEQRPDWYEDLSDDHVSAFKEVFDMLDSSHTGTLNADSLYEGLRRVDSEITRHEVEDVLRNLDKDGNGEIDFEEFLFHISHQGDQETDGEEGSGRRKALTKRQRLFYTAITEFHLKRTLETIQKAHLARVNQPHVLSHYTAGARLIGLTDRQLAMEMKRMQKSMKQQDSPYAKPLQLVVKEGGRRAVRKAIRPRRKPGLPAATATTAPAACSDTTPVTTQMSLMKQMAMQPTICIPSAGPLPAHGSQDVKGSMTSDQKKVGWSGLRTKLQDTPQPNVTFDNDLRESFRMLSERGSIMSKLPDLNKILAMRDKIVQDMAGKEEADPRVADDTTPPPARPTRPATAKPKSAVRGGTTSREVKETKAPKVHLRGRVMSKGWTIFRVDRDKVPLPALKIKYKHHKPTIEDLPNIREKVSKAIDDYYESLRQAHVQTGLDHWDRIYSHRIRSHKLMENFREVYRAYSPHKQEEAFVVCPWVTGPFRHIPSPKNGPRSPSATPFHRQQIGGRKSPDHAAHSSRSSCTGRSSQEGRTSRGENRPVSAF
ncbi:uncharacterized protein LOC124274467 [Haliotis rubra]|uniref:uncharacterized protein LOC124274467 n=1 Tax=Haliotis rubra TaxID=36100 RepID=UPI001EE60835|nr:uncharacterized protein LOC124274467 [Haliotis rubra]